MSYQLIITIALITVSCLAAILVDIQTKKTYRRFINFLGPMRERECTEKIQEDWSVLATGESGHIELEQAYLQSLQRMYELFCNKNHDYGSWNLAIGGPKGIVLRISDKVSRLWQITGLSGDGTEQVSDETMVDTFSDITNYAAVGALMAQGEWPDALMQEHIGSQAIVQQVLSVIENAQPEVKELVKEYLDINQ